MSDCFDHYIDAMEDNSPGGRGYEEGYGFTYNPLYYHSKNEDFTIKRETEKAILFTARGTDVWCPKALIRYRGKDTTYILRRHYVIMLRKVVEAIKLGSTINRGGNKE